MGAALGPGQIFSRPVCSVSHSNRSKACARVALEAQEGEQEEEAVV